MKFFVCQDLEDGEYTIYNGKMERIGSCLKITDDQIKLNISAITGISENKIHYVCDQLNYEVWEAKLANVGPKPIGALCPNCETRVDQCRDGNNVLLIYDSKETMNPINFCHKCDVNLVWEVNGWRIRTLQEVYGTWGSYPKYPVEDWQLEVANDDTRQGYWDWVEGKLEWDVSDRLKRVSEADALVAIKPLLSDESGSEQEIRKTMF